MDEALTHGHQDCVDAINELSGTAGQPAEEIEVPDDAEEAKDGEDMQLDDDDGGAEQHQPQQQRQGGAE